MRTGYLIALLATAALFVLIACRRSYNPFPVEIEGSVKYTKSPRVISIVGRTNLPDGSLLRILFTPGIQHEVTVTAGEFAVSEPIKKGAVNYRVRVVYLPNEEANKSRAIQPEGHNLQGDYVIDHPHFQGVKYVLRDWYVDDVKGKPADDRGQAMLVIQMAGRFFRKSAAIPRPKDDPRRCAQNLSGLQPDLAALLREADKLPVEYLIAKALGKRAQMAATCIASAEEHCQIGLREVGEAMQWMSGAN